ncbi:MAG: MBL fold metallo-hydrolase [Candidatus Rokubacteria bacterium]|nr:MBL fold metallo-hydrolase [Candidatus Rokubacteria bacterium]
MRIRFWGTRGSIPVAMTSASVKQKLVTMLLKAVGQRFDTVAQVEAFVEREGPMPYTFGGNSSCVQLDTGGRDYVLCDVGSGVRPFGNDVLARRGPTGHTFHVFMSHLHWDHIMGFPFFVPVYVPGNTIRIYGCHAALEEAFRRQHCAPSFPVDYGRLGATIEYVRLEPGRTYEVAGLRVRAMRQHHGGDSYGYRFEHDGKVAVYSTDSEHKLEDQAQTDAFVEFFRDADLVIFDAMYSLADAVTVKEDWGHSSNVVGVELCQRAGARRLCMFHHEPVYDDEQLVAVLDETRRFEEITRGERRLEVSSAYDGMEIEL